MNWNWRSRSCHNASHTAKQLLLEKDKNEGEVKNMRFIIVTGMSGAGKSAAMNALEDVGIYCMDNIPPVLVPKIAHLGGNGQDGEGIDRVALAIDARGLRQSTSNQDAIKELMDTLTELDREKVNYQILFLDASNEELINRYKITRRPHPLMGKSDSLTRAINQERELLRLVRERADIVLDTTFLSASQLRSNIHEMFRSSDPDKDDFVVNCISFGFKFGVPADADLMFDVRCLPNPFYEEHLRSKTGLDREVQDYVLSSPKTEGFLMRLYNFVDYMIPLYRHDEQKSQLMIAIGCTGGKHRSVTIALKLSEHLKAKGLRVITSHRDIEKKKL